MNTVTFLIRHPTTDTDESAYLAGAGRDLPVS